MVGRLTDVPEPVLDALAFPTLAHTTIVDAASIPFFVRSWGQSAEKPLLLLHGVSSSSLGWWRVGSGLAVAGFRVFAPDMPGHGRTGSWRDLRVEEELGTTGGTNANVDLTPVRDQVAGRAMPCADRTVQEELSYPLPCLGRVTGWVARSIGLPSEPRRR